MSEQNEDLIILTQKMVDTALANVIKEAGLSDKVYYAELNEGTNSACLYITGAEKKRRDDILNNIEDPLQRKGMSHGFEQMDSVIQHGLSVHMSRQMTMYASLSAINFGEPPGEVN